MEVYIIYSNPEQIAPYTLDESWITLDEQSIKTRKKAFALKGGVAARLTPVVIIKDQDKYKKVFYKEEFKDPIKEFINWYHANQSN